MTHRDLVTIELRLRPDASPPRIAGARLVKVFPGERDPDLKRMYLAYVPSANAPEMLQILEAHPLVETAKVLKRRKIRG
jgi:hypothetical protein